MGNQIIDHLQKICEDSFSVDVSGNCFRSCADFLMNSCLLTAGNCSFRLVEIEFYKYSLNHPDKFCHKNSSQRNFAKWYTHGGGIDITFGKKTTAEIFGGILIRGVLSIDSAEYIIGPLKVFDALMSCLDVTGENTQLKLGESNNQKRSEVKNFRRFNIDKMKNRFNEQEILLEKKFAAANYRYIIYQSLIEDAYQKRNLPSQLYS